MGIETTLTEEPHLPARISRLLGVRDHRQGLKSGNRLGDAHVVLARRSRGAPARARPASAKPSSSRAWGAHSAGMVYPRSTGRI